MKTAQVGWTSSGSKERASNDRRKAEEQVASQTPSFRFVIWRKINLSGTKTHRLDWPNSSSIPTRGWGETSGRGGELSLMERDAGTTWAQLLLFSETWKIVFPPTCCIRESKSLWRTKYIPFFIFVPSSQDRDVRNSLTSKIKFHDHSDCRLSGTKHSIHFLISLKHTSRCWTVTRAIIQTASSPW